MRFAKIGSVAVLVVLICTQFAVQASDESKGGIFAYVSEVDGLPNIFVKQGAGSAPRNLTPGMHATEPALSPDGTKIAFTSNRDGSLDIFVINVDGSGLANLTRHNARDRTPAWTPDGRILFESNRASPCDVFVMDADGNNVINLTNTRHCDIHPSASPDGKKIVFSSNRGDGVTQNMYLMDADGSNQTLLFASPSAVYQGVFSPDGTKIAFMRESSIWLVDVDNPDNIHQLTTREIHGPAQKPVFSPDGKKIAFQALDENQKWKIFVMNLDGSGFVRLSSGQSDTAPTWAAINR